MRVLVAEDEPVSRRVLADALRRWGYEAETTGDGEGAWQRLRGEGAPPLAILNWMMPKMDGVEVCRRVRESGSSLPPYIILLTARGGKEDIVSGLQAGADDYVSKPFDPDELRARVQVGERVVGLQSELAGRVAELEGALLQVRWLQGMLPMCSYCKKIRDDRDYWHEVETYISEHSEARFSHGICPDCRDRIVKPTLEVLGNVPDA